MSFQGVLTRLALGLLVGVVLANVGIAYRDAQLMKQRYDSARRDLEVLHQRNDRLRREIRALETDGWYIQLKMRERDRKRHEEQIIEEREK